MNSEFRKVALIAAALGLLVSLFFALRPDDEEGATPMTTVATTTAPAATETELPDVVTIRIAIPSDAAPTTVATRSSGVARSSSSARRSRIPSG